MTVSNLEDIGRRFAKLASEYCQLIDHASELEEREFLRRIQRLLPQLYAAGTELPSVEPDTDEPSCTMTSEAYADLCQRLSSCIGDRKLYWEVCDPTQTEQDEVVAGSMVDDLADIYRDIHNGLAVMPTDAFGLWNDAIWEWQLGWDTHWGRHAATAIRVLHWHLDPGHSEESSDRASSEEADA